ncbi:B12-binding domain-containing radical SAM protein [Thermodesulfobacteriota bacterium]
MKISLIRPRVQNAPDPPLGILSIATQLKTAGYEVQVLDPSPEDVSIYQKIIEFQPDILGLSILTTQFSLARLLIKWIRNNLPQTLVIAGGIHPTALPRKTLEDADVDVVIIGEGEITTQELCKKYESGRGFEGIPGTAYLCDGKIKFEQQRPFIRDLDSIPIIDRSLLDFDKYLRPPGNIRGLLFYRATSIISTRGCPFACMFCSCKAVFGNKIRRRSVDNVMEEIRALKKNYNIDALWFLDDTLTQKPERTIELARAFQKANLKIKWNCQGHVKKMSLNLFKEMKNSECVQVEFGIESGSPRILEVLRKEITIEDIIKCFSFAKEVGMRTLANIMIGNPTETEKDIEMTYHLAKKIKPDHVVVSFTTPLPGSELYEWSLKEGFLNGKEEFNVEWTSRQTEEPYVALTLDKTTLIKMRRKFDNYFFLANHKNYLKDSQFILGILLQIFASPRKYIHGLYKSLRRWRLGHIIETIWDEYNRI